MKLCTIETGLPPENLIPRFGTYPQMVERWLSPHLPEARFFSVSAVQGENLPAPETYDGYILTGSKHGIYEDLPWIANLRDFLVAAKQAGRPIFGICFGHQIMAEAFGGKAVKSERGWGVGAHHYDYAAASGPGDGASFVFHQDQVTETPPSARVIGAAGHCPIGALEYDFPALSVQHHPEFTRAYIEALLDLRGGSTISAAVTEKARASIADFPVDSAPVARWAADFFRKTLAKQAA